MFVKRAAVFIYRGGLVYWFDIEADRKFVYCPDEGRIYPEFCASDWDEVILVDRNVTTGRTLERARLKLNIPEEKCIKAGSVVGDYGRKVVDIELDRDGLSGYILSFSGPAGVAKTFLAKGIAHYRGIPYYKVGRYARILGAGRYGERLAEIESEDPFILVKLMADDMKRCSSNDPLVIVDGLKNMKSAIFLSYVLKRPLIGFYVDADFKERMIRWRQDEDDAYAVERAKLFKDGLEELRRSFTEITTSDFATLKPLAEVLERFGYASTLRVWGWDVFGTKRIWLDVYKRYVLEGRIVNAKLDAKCRSIVYHHRYVEKYGLRGEAAKMVQEVATAFRFIDDILDEHDTRWEKPARWVETSPVEALAEAEILTTKALKRAERLGCRKEFLEMFEAVLDAVYYEIDVEEGRAEFISEEDWKRAAGREAHFRAFIGYLKGEDPVKYYQEGLKAQMKDDVMGAEKGERENTDERLKRPLWQKIKVEA